MSLSSASSASDQEFQELLEQARSGDGIAMGRLLQRFRLYLMKVADDEADTDWQAKEGDSDVVQDAYAEALRAFQQFDGQTSEQMRGWLRTIVLRQISDARDRYHAKKRRGPHVSIEDLRARGNQDADPEDEKTSPSEQAVRSEEHERVMRAMQSLSDLDREIIALRQIQDLSFPDIARRLELSVAAAKKRWQRALQALEQKVSGRHGNDLK